MGLFRSCDFDWRLAIMYHPFLSSKFVERMKKKKKLVSTMVNNK